MRKFLLFAAAAAAIVFCLSFSGPADSAMAASGGGREVSEGETYNAKSDISVYGNFQEDGEQLLFAIPATYYFTVTRISRDNDKYYVSYAGLTAKDYCYIRSDADFGALSNRDKGETGAFAEELEFSGEAADFCETDGIYCIQDKKSVEAKDVSSVEFIGFSVRDGIECAYVRLNGKTCGFVPRTALRTKSDGTSLEDFKIPPHPNYVPEKTESKTEEEDEGMSLTRIILISGIAVSGLIITFLMFKPRKITRYDYERNRDYDMGSSPYDAPRSRYRDDPEDYGPPRGGGYGDGRRF